MFPLILRVTIVWGGGGIIILFATVSIGGNIPM